MAPVLTLHHGDAEASFTEHPWRSPHLREVRDGPQSYGSGG